MPDPVGSEFNRLVEGLKVGVTLDQGLKKMYESMPTAEVGFFAIVMTIQQKSGGNLSEALGNLAGVLRDRKRLEGKIKAMSSEAKASAGIIGSLPPGVMGIVYLTTPGYISLLFTEHVGNLMLVGCVVWMGIGIMRDAQDDQLQALEAAMLSVGIFDILFDKTFLATLAAAIFAFATIVTLGLPLVERDGLGERLKSVAERREELRAKHHAALNAKRGELRVEPVGYMKATLDRFKLANLLESENTRDKLAQAGYRGQAPLITFMFFRFVMPFVVFVVALFYLFVITHFHWSPMMKLGASSSARAARLLSARPLRQQRHRAPPAIHHARLSRRAGPDADLRGIRHVDRSRVSARRRRDRHPVRRSWPRNWPDHRRTLLSARPPPGLRQSGQALRPSRRQGGGDRAQPGGKIRHARWARRCASPRRKTAKCACRRPRRRPPRCRPSSPCR